ncbi:MAG TPA: phosphate propanoyltransferase [Clostridia bacterium]|nr:phosphate propanoyltransferase [Clostridia bacterium]
MDATAERATVQRLVTERIVKSAYEQSGKRYVPAAASNRHIHVSAQDLETLFGKGYALRPERPLSQPGQYAASEIVTIAGPKGRIDQVRVLGPARGKTQVEILTTDAFRLGVSPVVRISGDIEGTPGATVIGPAGTVELASGVIVAMRHVHISVEQAVWLGLKNGDLVSIKKEGVRALVFDNVPVRCGEGHNLELHLDMEEANAGSIKNGELLEIVGIVRKA